MRPASGRFALSRRRTKIGGRDLVVDDATSARLARIPRADTGPELAVRRIVSRLGHRYRTGNRDLPGSPDLANRRAGWAIFVHGCFWHAHSACSRATVPKRNREFWIEKLGKNRARDVRVAAELEARGFAVLTLWECELANESTLRRRLRSFLRDAVERPSPGTPRLSAPLRRRIRPAGRP